MWMFPTPIPRRMLKSPQVPTQVDIPHTPQRKLVPISTSDADLKVNAMMLHLSFVPCSFSAVVRMLVACAATCCWVLSLLRDSRKSITSAVDRLSGIETMTTFWLYAMCNDNFSKHIFFLRFLCRDFPWKDFMIDCLVPANELVRDADDAQSNLFFFLKDCARQCSL